jgi:hypothetical protein
MDSINEETQKSTTSFVQHVFQFDNDTKSELLNILQYSILAIIPIIVLNKTVQNFIPPADEEKGTVEILLEIFAQIVLLFGGMFFIDRVITYAPTYSGENYKSVNFITMILGFLIIVLSLQTKLGEKAEILYERFMDLIGAESKEEPVKQTSQSQQKNIVQQDNRLPANTTPMPPTQHVSPPSQMYNDPMMNNQQFGQGHVSMNSTRPEMNMNGPQQPAFDQMYQEPMAANDGFGAFGSAF